MALNRQARAQRIEKCIQGFGVDPFRGSLFIKRRGGNVHAANAAVAGFPQPFFEPRHGRDSINVVHFGVTPGGIELSVTLFHQHQCFDNQLPATASNGRMLSKAWTGSRWW